MMMSKVLTIATATLTTAALCTLAFGSQASADDAKYEATLRDPKGRVVGTVEFRIQGDVTHVDAKLKRNRYVAPNAFHGFHVHANNDPANGKGCIADPAEPSSSWFVSADGHASEAGQSHGGHNADRPNPHNGDMPSPLVMADGKARLTFSTDRIDPDALRHQVVILHAKADNFGNVPTGTAPNQYTANSAAATDLTARTGNASDRVACGKVRRSR